jgi:hypothetical protein
VSARDLKQRVGKSGRPQSDWYDDFTRLLLDIAHKAGVKPRLSKDRSFGTRAGWLLDAAQTLETFLDPQMRSPSAEACGKRLERANKNLKQQPGQNLSPA